MLPGLSRPSCRPVFLLRGFRTRSQYGFGCRPSKTAVHSLFVRLRRHDALPGKLHLGRSPYFRVNAKTIGSCRTEGESCIREVQGITRSSQFFIFRPFDAGDKCKYGTQNNNCLFYFCLPEVLKLKSTFFTLNP